MHLIYAHMTDQELTSPTVMPRVLRELVCDGILLSYTHESPESLPEVLSRYALPTIWINRKMPLNCVYADEFAASHHATQHLRRLGHRRIAMVHFGRTEGDTPDTWHFSDTDRYEGYVAAMRTAEAGLRPRHALRPAGVLESDSLALAKALLSGPDRPTAALCYDREQAELILYAAAAMGLAVPRDLSVLAFAEEPRLTLGEDLSVMRIPAKEVGREAVQMICDRIERPTEPLPARPLSHVLHLGKTCGAPAAEHGWRRRRLGSPNGASGESDSQMSINRHRKEDG
jgi:LacI family transcriptional regulator